MDALEFNLINQHRVPGSKTPVPVITEIINNGSAKPEYVGVAKRGSATSDAAWVVTKITYFGDGTVSKVRTSPPNSIMDNYLTLTYA